MATKFWISTSNTSFNTGTNWSDGNAPANSDVLVFNHLGTASVETNLSTVLTGLTIIVEQSFAGRIGVLSGSTATYLVIDGGTLEIGKQTGQSRGSGSALIMVNFGSTAGVVNLIDSSTIGSTTYYPPVIFKGTGVTLNQAGGSAMFAGLTGETGTLTAATITKSDKSEVAPNLYIGKGATATALTSNAGAIYSRSDNTTGTTTLSGKAEYTTEGTGAHTTIACDEEAKVFYGSTGTITTLNLSGEFSNSRYPQSFTITNANLYEGYKLLIDNGKSASITFSNDPAHVRCSYQDGKIEAPPGRWI